MTQCFKHAVVAENECEFSSSKPSSCLCHFILSFSVKTASFVSKQLTSLKTTWKLLQSEKQLFNYFKVFSLYSSLKNKNYTFQQSFKKQKQCVHIFKQCHLYITGVFQATIHRPRVLSTFARSLEQYFSASSK